MNSHVEHGKAHPQQRGFRRHLAVAAALIAQQRCSQPLTPTWHHGHIAGPLTPQPWTQDTHIFWQAVLEARHDRRRDRQLWEQQERRQRRHQQLWQWPKHRRHQQRRHQVQQALLRQEMTASVVTKSS